MKKYKKIIITNLPAFYKIRLFNEVNKEIPLLVLFTGHSSDGRNADFYKGKIDFDYINLDRGLFLNVWLLISLLRKSLLEELILSGWDNIYMWIALLLSPKRKNSVIIESSIHESPISGIKGKLKKFFLSRCIKVYVPGKSNAELVYSLGFKSDLIKTKGCGVFNYIPQPKYEPREVVKRFIYVGRLVKEKNLNFLISVFNKLPELTLDIVGFGPLEEELRDMASSNITFYGAVNNEDLPSRYGEADVFILASYSETWGIVVEEALNNGLPVIVSDKVGCAEELINETNGLIFKSNDENSLRDVIRKILNIEYYNQLRFNISFLNFEEVEKEQIKCYI